MSISIIHDLKEEDTLSGRWEEGSIGGSVMGSLAVDYDTADALTIGSDDGFDNNSAVIMDLGSYSIKAGFARGSDDRPHVVPSLISKTVDNTSRYIGQDAVDAMISYNKLSFPIKQGIVQCWDDFELILDYTIETELKISPKSYGQTFIMTEKMLNPEHNREKLAQIMFEKYEIPGLSILPAHWLSLMSCSQVTGLVIDIGEDVTFIVPVFEDYAIVENIQKFALGGASITKYLMKMLNKRGVELGYEVVNSLKERVCYVDMNFATAVEGEEVLEDVVMSDSLTIQMGHERFQAPEILLKPSLDDHNFGGLVGQIVACAMSCDVEVRDAMLSSIVLSGQPALTKGLRERLESELRVMASKDVSVKCAEQYTDSGTVKVHHSALQGGCILASTCGQCLEGSVPQYTIEQYQESGASIVHRKH